MTSSLLDEVSRYLSKRRHDRSAFVLFSLTNQKYIYIYIYSLSLDISYIYIYITLVFIGLLFSFLFFVFSPLFFFFLDNTLFFFWITHKHNTQTGVLVAGQRSILETKKIIFKREKILSASRCVFNFFYLIFHNNLLLVKYHFYIY